MPRVGITGYKADQATRIIGSLHVVMPRVGIRPCQKRGKVMDSSNENPVVTRLPGLQVHESSVTHHEGMLYFLADTDDGQRRLAVGATSGSPHLTGFEGMPQAYEEQTLLLCPLSAENAAELRTRLAWLQPRVQGLRTTV